jgi:uncharacterized membrane protein YphA (DoxX/SURF4 family)
MKELGARVYGLAAVFIGVLGLLWGDFEAGWIPVPATLPGRLLLAYAVGALLVAGGVLINWRRTFVWGAALLTGVFATGLVLADLTRFILRLTQFDYWEATAEQVAITAGGLTAWASQAKIDQRLASRLQHAARIALGLSLVVFGIAHVVYLAYTASLVPKWLPPGQVFWTYATGAAQAAAGLALLSGVLDLLAARLLTAMYVIFGILVHIPLLRAAPANRFEWSENAVNLILVGVAWITADSLAARQRLAGSDSSSSVAR